MKIHPKRAHEIHLGFFGTSHLAVFVLDELERLGLTPGFVVTVPDKTQGRGLLVEPTAVKRWALHRNIDVFQPQKLHTDILEYMSMS